MVGHLAAVAHAIVGWPQGARQPRSPALPQVVPSACTADGRFDIQHIHQIKCLPANSGELSIENAEVLLRGLQHGPRLPLLPAPAPVRPPLMAPLPNGPLLPPRPAAPMGAYLPAGQPRPATVFSQVAASLQQPAGVAVQAGTPPGQSVGQHFAAAGPAASPQPAQPWQPPATQGLPPLKRIVVKELCILDLGDAQRRKFLRVGPASCQWYHRSWLPGPAALHMVADRLTNTT